MAGLRRLESQGVHLRVEEFLRRFLFDEATGESAPARRRSSTRRWWSGSSARSRKSAHNVERTPEHLSVR